MIHMKRIEEDVHMVIGVKEVVPLIVDMSAVLENWNC